MSGAQLGAAEEADRGVLLGGKGGFIDREGGKEGDGFEPGLTILLHQVHAHAAGHEGEDGVRGRGGGAGASSAEKSSWPSGV